MYCLKELNKYIQYYKDVILTLKMSCEEIKECTESSV